MAISDPRYPEEEAAHRGDEIYERDVLPTVTTSNRGMHVAIDIESGEWEMNSDEIAAGDLLRARIPDAETWMTRVGYGYIRGLGVRGGRGRA